jgi:hypothetical protein
MKLDGHWNFIGATIWKTPGFETNDLGYIRQADQVLSVLWAGYNQWEPKGIYRRYNINADIFLVNNFGGDLLGTGFEWNASMGLKNYWNIWIGGNLQSSSRSTGILRGGTTMKLPGDNNARLGFSTDSRKSLVFEYYFNGSRGNRNYTRNLSTGLDITYKPTDYLSLSFSPGISNSFSELQYVTRLNVNNTDKYIFASIDQKTISTSFRINLNLSPNLTFQYWGQPFVATGKYYDHKYILQPMAEKYRERFWTYTEDQINLEENDYNIDENLDGTDDYSFEKRDFNVQEFLSNLVIRWEYNPGSSVFLVWSQTRSYSNDSGNMRLFDDLGDLFNRDNNTPHNVFLIKFSYRFGLR